MISAWHLIWIIPCAACVGFMAAALCRAGRDE